MPRRRPGLASKSPFDGNQAEFGRATCLSCAQLALDGDETFWTGRRTIISGIYGSPMAAVGSAARRARLPVRANVSRLVVRRTVFKRDHFIFARWLASRSASFASLRGCRPWLPHRAVGGRDIASSAARRKCCHAGSGSSWPNQRFCSLYGNPQPPLDLLPRTRPGRCWH